MRIRENNTHEAMKPEYIILIRHGESEGNVNKEIYRQKPDFALNLTLKGQRQANEAGHELRKLIGSQKVWYYRSPFYRTRQTWAILNAVVPGDKDYEDPRLREQEHTPRILREVDEGERGDVEKERDDYGHFYYQFEGGESCANVFDRVSDFIGTLFRDFEKPEFPGACVIVSHGMTNRVFLMRFLHYTVEQFEFLRNPKNCGMFVLKRETDDKYALTEEPRKYETRNCKY